jgi:predicted dehydrogenase
MKFGFAGVKHPHADSWAEAVAATGGTIAAVYDPSSELAASFAAEHGGEPVDAVASFAGRGLSAIVVDGRCDEVTALALASLELGLPIFLEKPGGMGAADLARIDATARERSVVTQMGYFLRYGDPVLEAKTAIDRGELGKLQLVRVHAGMPHAAWTVMGAWFKDPTNITSIFQEDACHVVDVTQELLGPPRGVVAQRVTGQFVPTVGEDAIAAILDYGTHLATIDFTAHEANPWIETWSVELFGSEGTIRFGLGPTWRERYAAGAWQVNDESRMTTSADGHVGTFDSREVYRRGMAGFFAAVVGKGESPVDSAKGLRVFRTVEAIAEAASSGRRVAL